MRIQGDNFGNETVFKHQLHHKIITYPAHIHQLSELIFVLDGEMILTVDGKEERLKPGDAALIFPFQTHKFYSADKVKVAMYLFSASLMPSFFSANDGKVGERSIFTPSKATAQHFYEKLVTEADLTIYSVKAFLYLSICDFLSQNQLVDGVADTNVASKVAVYLNKHFHEQVTLKSVASAIGYSPNYLSHCIQKLFNLNFCSLLACLRVDMARKLLVETDKPCLDICYECGFNSERSFYRQFKSITGKTAKDYRESYACKSISRPKVKYF